MGSINYIADHEELRKPMEKMFKENRPKVISLFGDEHDEFGDKAHNELWDKFTQVADRANSWRDHETLDELLGIIALLRDRIEIPDPAAPVKLSIVH